MDLLVNTSLVAAFFAGVAALFAPCCITILLPVYFASIFRQRRTVFLMTFVYFLGLLVVFLPIGLAAGAFARLFSENHWLIFLLGGTFLVGLGVTLLLGKQWSLPWRVNPSLKGTGFMSVFLLGILSGLATTCCAPVLAGVIAMAAIPGSVVLAGAYTLAYVLGIVAPLFIMAALLDRTNVLQYIYKLRRPLSYRLLGLHITSTVANTLVGLAYLVLGVFVLRQVGNNDLSTHSTLQLNLNIWITKLLQFLQPVISLLPEWAWAVGLFAALALLTRKAYITLKHGKPVAPAGGHHESRH